MKKINLLAAVLNADLKDIDMTDDQRKERIAAAIKEATVEFLNIHQFFRNLNVSDDTMKEIIENEGLGFNLKTKKFY